MTATGLCPPSTIAPDPVRVAEQRDAIEAVRERDEEITRLAAERDDAQAAFAPTLERAIRAEQERDEARAELRIALTRAEAAQHERDEARVHNPAHEVAALRAELADRTDAYVRAMERGLALIRERDEALAAVAPLRERCSYYELASPAHRAAVGAVLRRGEAWDIRETATTVEALEAALEEWHALGRPGAEWGEEQGR